MADNNPNRIYQQIEATADYYDPGLYYSRLTQNHSLEISPDSLSGSFIPLSTAPATPDAKLCLFVVGLIPPSAQVTGKLIDRSASVSALQGGGGAIAIDMSSASTGAGKGGGDPNLSTNGGPPDITTLSPKQAAAAMYQALLQKTGRAPTAAEVAMYVTQSKLETGLKWPDNNPGFVGNAAVGHPRPGGQPFFYWGPTKTTFYSYDTPVDGAAGYFNFIPNKAQQAAQKGDTAAYVQALEDVHYFGGPENSAEYLRIMNANYNYIKGQIGPVGDLASVSLPGSNSAMTSGGISTDPNWKNTGSSSANNAQQQISQNSQTNLNNTTLGKKFAQAQYNMALQVATEIAQMANTPPLRLLVNPASFKVGNEKIISDGNFTRTGPIVEHWGDGQDKIDASGKIGAFYCADVTGVGSDPLQESGGPGLTRTARTFSAAYQNFLSLYQIYRNNAGIHIDDTVDPSAGKKNLVMLGSVYIYFDHTMYIGSFDSFTVTESDTAPFTLEYSFQFTTRATFLMDQVTDPKFTFGYTNLNVNAGTNGAIPTSDPSSGVPYNTIGNVANDPTQPTSLQQAAENQLLALPNPVSNSSLNPQAPGSQLPGTVGVTVNGQEI